MPSAHNLPGATEDIEQSKSHIDRYGNCLIANTLTPFVVEAARTRLIEQAAAELEQGAAEETVAAKGPAGTAMVFDGRLWHGTGANVSDVNRYGLLTTFCGTQFRPQENFTIGTRTEVLAEASPEPLSLLGFRIWSGYGRVESPVAEFVSQGERSLGELHIAHTEQGF